MIFQGFTTDRMGIFIHLDNIALRFDSVEEMEELAKYIIESANEIKED